MTDETTKTEVSFAMPLNVQMSRTAKPANDPQALWAYIRSCAKAIDYNTFKAFIDYALLGEGGDSVPQSVKDLVGDAQGSPSALQQLARKSGAGVSTPFPDMDIYKGLVATTDIFLMKEVGVELPVFPTELNATEESDRFGRTVTAAEIEQIFEQNYLANIGDLETTSPTRTGGRRLAAGGTGATEATVFDKTFPYLELVRSNLGLQVTGDAQSDIQTARQFLYRKLTRPVFVELLWSYWHEEGLLAQTMARISLRFQNRRVPGEDPLAQVNVAPLYPLNNVLWGYIQDEQHRLSVTRRAYEYDQHYGLRLHGKAVGEIQPADSRAKFIEAFHNTLYLASQFYRQDDDTTVIADAFPLLNALKELHLILTEGMHNQYGDLPWTARREMLVQQWILGRKEMQQFLPWRQMVAYPEAWMGAVDAMKRIQGWDDVPSLNFHELARTGEVILIGARIHRWSQETDSNVAANWARYFRSEIQSYSYYYQTVSGVDLAAPMTVTQQASARYAQPSSRLRARLNARRAQAALSSSTGVRRGELV